MTKQNYEKPNMEIVLLEDVIKTSGGCDGVGYSCSGDICPDEICASYGGGCSGYIVPCYGYGVNNQTLSIICDRVFGMP